MPGPFMATIIMRGVGDIEVAHEFAEIAQRGLGQDVPMIIHQHKTVQADAIGIYRMRENRPLPFFCPCPMRPFHSLATENRIIFRVSEQIKQDSEKYQ